MKTLFLVAFVAVVCCLLSDVHGSRRGNAIAAKANSYIDSTSWSYYTYRRGIFPFQWKCNIFVAEVLEEAGASVPHRKSDSWSPIGAGEWGNAQSTYLRRDSCWTTTTSPSLGDVAGNGRHVGIVSGSRLTTSALKRSVEQNDWGFDTSDRNRVATVFWRYIC